MNAMPAGVVTDRYTAARRETLAARSRRDAMRRADPSAPVRLLVIAQTPSTWGSLAPIVDAARRRRDAEVLVAAVDSPGQPAGTVTALLRTQRITSLPLDAALAQLDDVDVAVLADPYDALRPEPLRTGSLLARGIRLALSPYAENIGGETARHYDAPLHNLAWRVFAADTTQQALFAQHCASGAEHVRALGSVKGDWLTAGGRGVQAAATALRARLGTPAVALWNPHFRRGDGGWSTFERYANDLLHFAARNPRTGLIIRPHARLLPDLAMVDGGPGFVASFRREAGRLRTVHLDETPDYRASFTAADAMISDLSSLIPEYLRLGKPVGYLAHPTPPDTVADEAWLPRVERLIDTADVQRFLRSVRRTRTVIDLTSDLATDVGAGERIAAAIVEDFRREASGCAVRQGSSPSPDRPKLHL